MSTKARAKPTRAAPEPAPTPLAAMQDVWWGHGRLYDSGESRKAYIDAITQRLDLLLTVVEQWRQVQHDAAALERWRQAPYSAAAAQLAQKARERDEAKRVANAEWWHLNKGLILWALLLFSTVCIVGIGLVATT